MYCIDLLQIMYNIKKHFQEYEIFDYLRLLVCLWFC